jgi:hypothetical protein
MTPKFYTKGLAQSKLRAITHLIAEYGIYRSRPYVMHLYDLGYSSQKIADIIGTSRQAIEQDYPREVK